MCEKLFVDAYAILDDGSRAEEDRVDAVESLVHERFPDLKSGDAERLVLDLLMAHHRGKNPAEAADALVLGPQYTSGQVPRAKGPPANKAPLSAQPAASAISAPAAGSAAHKEAIPAPYASLKPFDQLRKLFGWENSDEDIERALAHNDFNLERTIGMLSGEEAEAELTKEQMASRIMCRYFISGGCVRGAQCMYSHDGKSRLCRFWLHQRCLADDSCIFLHEVPPAIIDSVGQDAEAPTEPRLPSLSALPALGAQKGQSKKNKRPQPAAAPPSSRPHVTLRPIKDVLSSHRGLVPLVYPRLVPWKATKFGKNETYCELRAQASQCGEQRNKLLLQSTNAWSRNDAFAAKNLSDKGRQWEQQMIQCYREAAVVLWEQRQLPSSESWIDLHGLDLGDAVAELEDKLEEAARAKHSPRPLYVVTGRGHFKAKRYADQMSQYVLAYLDTHGYKHKDFGVDRQYGRITAIDPWSKLRSDSAVPAS